MRATVDGKFKYLYGKSWKEGGHALTYELKSHGSTFAKEWIQKRRILSLTATQEKSILYTHYILNCLFSFLISHFRINL